MLSIKIINKKKNSSWTKGDKPWKINIFQGLPPFVQEDVFWDNFYWPQVYKELIPKKTSKGYCKEIQNSRHLVSTQVAGFIMWHSLIYYSTMVITCKPKLMFLKSPVYIWKWQTKSLSFISHYHSICKINEQLLCRALTVLDT